MAVFVPTHVGADRRRRLKGKTQAQISRDAWLDESYVSRLFSESAPIRAATLWFFLELGAWSLSMAMYSAGGRGSGRTADGGGLQAADPSGKHSVAPLGRLAGPRLSLRLIVLLSAHYEPVLDRTIPI